MKDSPANRGWTVMLTAAVAEAARRDEASAAVDQLVVEFVASDRID